MSFFFCSLLRCGIAFVCRLLVWGANDIYFKLDNYSVNATLGVALVSRGTVAGCAQQNEAYVPGSP